LPFSKFLVSPQKNDTRTLHLALSLHHNTTTYHKSSGHPTMDNAPAVKPWGSEDKELLQKLIDQGKVDITRTDNLAYIDQVKHKHFRSHETYNLRRNFRNYARSCELEDHLAGYQRQEGIVFLCFVYFIDSISNNRPALLL
jgi:hypothetical protein